MSSRVHPSKNVCPGIPNIAGFDLEAKGLAASVTIFELSENPSGLLLKGLHHSDLRVILEHSCEVGYCRRLPNRPQALPVTIPGKLH
jgi:hypothetical protein